MAAAPQTHTEVPAAPLGVPSSYEQWRGTNAALQALHQRHCLEQLSAASYAGTVSATSLFLNTAVEDWHNEEWQHTGWEHWPLDDHATEESLPCLDLGAQDERWKTALSTFDSLPEDAALSALSPAHVSPLKLTSISSSASLPHSSQPRKVCSFEMSSVRWDALQSGRERRTTLRLRGLPRSVCSPGVMEHILASNGLDECVNSIRFVSGKGRALACAIVHIASTDDVAKVAKFFHGRQFGSAAPVAVSFAETSMQSLLDPCRAALPGAAGRLSKLADPQWIPTPAQTEDARHDAALEQATDPFCVSSKRSVSSPRTPGGSTACGSSSPASPEALSDDEAVVVSATASLLPPGLEAERPASPATATVAVSSRSPCEPCPPPPPGLGDFCATAA